MTVTHRRAALNWKGLVLLVVAVAVVVVSILWVWWPIGPVQPIGVPQTDHIAGGAGVPVRILLLDLEGGAGTIQLCDDEDSDVLLRWYAADPPGGAIVKQEKISAVKGRAAIKLLEGLTPTAQAMDPNGRPVGSEVGPGQSGTCP